MDLTFSAEPDPARFEARVRSFLSADAVRRTLPITVLDAVVSGQYDRWVLAAVAESDGTVHACAVQTPPYNVIVAANGSDEAVALLARGLREQGLDFPGVAGLSPSAERFAEAWGGGVPGGTELHRGSRLFRLDTVVAPREALGQPRLGTPDDLDLLVDWTEAFHHEATGSVPGRLDRILTARIDDRRVWLWDGSHEAVSYLTHSPVLHGHARIGPVYTPPEHRGSGYASNLVAHVSQHLLDLGAVPTLFTDLANPTSNAIYRAVGYEPVADAVEISFAQ